MPIPARHLAALSDAQRARLETEADLRAAFEGFATPFLPQPQGVCWSGMSGDVWVPVQACFENAERSVRMERGRRGIAA